MPSCWAHQAQGAWLKMLLALRCRSHQPNSHLLTAIPVQFFPGSGLTSRSPKELWVVTVGSEHDHCNDAVTTFGIYP